MCAWVHFDVFNLVDFDPNDYGLVGYWLRLCFLGFELGFLLSYAWFKIKRSGDLD